MDNFDKNTISLKVERFKGKTLFFLPFTFPSLLNKQGALSLLTPPPFFPFPFPSFLFSHNLISKHSVSVCNPLKLVWTRNIAPTYSYLELP